MHPPLPPAEMRQRVETALLLAGIASLLAWPMFALQFERLGTLWFAHPPDAAAAWRLALRQAVVVFAVLLPSALVGMLYAHRLGLPGLGQLRWMRFWLGASLIAGTCATPIVHGLMDRALLAALPQLYPATVPAAFLDMAGSALVQEIILRAGLLTILVYFLRRAGFRGHPWPANLPIALFAALGLARYLDRLAVDDPTAPLWIALLLSFVLQWIYGEMYLRYGLLAAMGVHFGLSVKFAWYAGLGWVG